MILKPIVVGELETNAYIFSINDRDCCIIDPGGQGEIIAQAVKDLQLNAKLILFTHGHLDHLLGTSTLLSSLSRSGMYCSVYIHQAEMHFTGHGCLEAHSNMLYSLDPHMITQYATEISQIPKADHSLQEGDTLADVDLEIIHTPGHSPGSVCLYHRKEGVLFSGDTLFYGSVGRTDLPGGDGKKLKESLNKLAGDLPEHTAVYPGHGPQTSIFQEKKINPFL